MLCEQGWLLMLGTRVPHGCAGWRQGPLPLLAEATCSVVHKGAFASPPCLSVWVSFCPHSVYLSEVPESWWPQLPDLPLGPREELGGALDSHGATALTRDTEHLQSWMQIWVMLLKRATALCCGNATPGAQWHLPREGGSVLRSPGYPRTLSPGETR